jgi:hypothetical protein
MFLKLSAQSSIIVVAYTGLLDVFELWAKNFNVVKADFGCMDTLWEKW